MAVVMEHAVIQLLTAIQKIIMEYGNTIAAEMIEKCIENIMIILVQVLAV
jgi:hypothetical protein